MKYAFLVALREYMENAKTKGFWIGLLLFPIILGISLSAPELLNKATPTRNFVLVDRSNDFGPQVEATIARLHALDVMKEFGGYLQEHGTDERTLDLDAAVAALQDVARKSGEPVPPTKQLRSFLAPIVKMGQKALEDRPAKDFEQIQAIDFEAMQKVLNETDLGLTQALAAEPMRRVLQSIAGVPEDAPPFEEPKKRFRQVELPPELRDIEDLSQLSEELRPYLRGDEQLEVGDESLGLFAAILIPADLETRLNSSTGGLPIALPGVPGGSAVKVPPVQYWGANLADTELKKSIEREINKEIRRRAFRAKDFDLDEIERIQKMRAPFSLLNPKKKEGEEEVSLADQIRQWAPVGFVYLLWIGIFTISQMLLSNTIEEKSNRIIEVLLSSVTPGELMMGKLFGIAAVGLTMIGAWLLSLVLFLMFRSGPEAEWATQLYQVLKTSGLLPAFVLYFLLGYLIYSGLFLAIGSVCNTLKDAQNLMGPIMLIMIVPLFTMMFIPKDPNGTLATVLSWIPIYTPFIMMNRAAADPPLFDVVGTMVLLVVSTLLVLWMSSRIFRVGILRTGQPPKLLELLRWFRRGA